MRICLPLGSTESPLVQQIATLRTAPRKKSVGPCPPRTNLRYRRCAPEQGQICSLYIVVCLVFMQLVKLMLRVRHHRRGAALGAKENASCHTEFGLGRSLSTAVRSTRYQCTKKNANCMNGIGGGMFGLVPAIDEGQHY